MSPENSFELAPPPVTPEPDEDISLLALGASLLAGRRIIILCTAISTVIGLAVGLIRAPVYHARTALILGSPEGGELSQLRGLASQFGVNVGGSKGLQLTPDLVARIATSPQLLRNHAMDSIEIPELGPGMRNIGELLKAKQSASDDPLERERWLREVMKALGERITATADKRTGTVTIAADAIWPSLALQLVQRTAADLDSAVFALGKQRASAERMSIEQRIETQEQRLRREEEALAKFLLRNRQYDSSPELRFEYERLQRGVALQQQVLVSLSQSREDVLSREIQAAPSLTVVESPLPPVLPEPRKIIFIIAVSMLAGLFTGAAVVISRAALSTALSENTPYASAFRAEWDAVRNRSRLKT